MNARTVEDGLPRVVPVTVVGGFLGVGKTTLLNHLIRDASSRASRPEPSPSGPAGDGTERRLGVIVNDFGAINIDASLVVGVEGDLVQLSNGCICCTMRDDLDEALQRLLAVPQPPTHVIIEASGVSDPRRVAESLETGPAGRAGLVTIDAVVIVLDVEQHLGLGRRERIVANGQIATADILVLNKIDLVDEATLRELEEKLGRRGRRARILRASHGQVPAPLVLGVEASDAARRIEGPEGTDARLDVHVHALGDDEPAHAHAHDHTHAHHDHAAEFWTWSFHTQRPLSARRLRRTVNELPRQVVRAKGTVHLASHPDQRAVMHVVGRRAELCLDAPWGDRDPATGLVVIGAGDPLPPQRLEAMFRACEVEPKGRRRAGRKTSSPMQPMRWLRWVKRVLPSRPSSAAD